VSRFIGSLMWFLGFALLIPATVEAAESRCNELGAACVCSEPLNAQMTIPPATFVNPPDSTDHECAGEANDHKSVYAVGGGAMVAAFGMPAGSSVNQVWRIDGGGIAHLTGTNLNFTTGTICTRLYQRFSPDFPDIDASLNPPQRAKLMQISLNGSGYLHQTEWYEYSPWRVSLSIVGYGVDESVGYYGTGGRGSVTGSQVALNDCRNSWCRFEQCIDKDSTTVVGRGRIVVLNTGATMTFTSDAGSFSGSVTTGPMWIGNLFRQNSSTGSRYVSYGAEAFWPQANGSWIGPAYEVEPSAAPTGVTPAPAAPLLLQ